MTKMGKNVLNNVTKYESNKWFIIVNILFVKQNVPRIKNEDILQ